MNKLTKNVTGNCFSKDLIIHQEGIKMAKTTLRLNTFSNRIINEWNSLPIEVISDQDINDFNLLSKNIRQSGLYTLLHIAFFTLIFYYYYIIIKRNTYLYTFAEVRGAPPPPPKDETDPNKLYKIGKGI